MISSHTKEPKEPTILTSIVTFENGANLPIKIEIVDSNGSKLIYIYVPFWVVTSSSIPITYQHDPNLMIEKELNGTDELMADQIFNNSKILNDVNDKSSNQIEQITPMGIGKSRGGDGIIIGPDTPILGLKDFLNFDKMNRFPSVVERSANESAYDSTYNNTSSLSYNLLHCSFTDPHNLRTRLRLRAKGTSWCD